MMERVATCGAIIASLGLLGAIFTGMAVRHSLAASAMTSAKADWPVLAGLAFVGLVDLLMMVAGYFIAMLDIVMIGGSHG